ncbi:MAG: phosphomannomutase [Rickettsiales bacterium]|nr:phosphomannomutase [Rickettsiales bacterium]
MKYFFDPTIIREYDIRGIYGDTLKKDDAKIIGHIFGLSLKKNKTVNICCDGRKSSQPLKERLIEGLSEVGCNIIDIGIGPTPMLYYSNFLNNSEAGIMITGSHNPPSHNGFKIVKNKMSFFGDDLKRLAKSAENYDFIKKKSFVKKKNIENLYVNLLIKNLNQVKKLNIVWDAGNGSAGNVMKKIAQHIKGKRILLYEDIDGDFPNHHPDPSDPATLKDLIKSVKHNNMDLGIAFDGDGDRIGVVDNQGNIIPGDLLLLLLGVDVLKKKKGACIIGDVKCSQVLFDEIKKIGGRPIMSKTGHSLIKDCMKKESADLAGEMSGHIFFADDYYGFDDALYASIRLLNILSSSKKKLSELMLQFPKLYNTPEIRINCEEKEKFKIIEQIITNQKKNNYSAIDGIRVKCEQGWWLMRASNTQAAIVLRCEANTAEGLSTMKDTVKEELKRVKPELVQQIT